MKPKLPLDIAFANDFQEESPIPNEKDNEDNEANIAEMYMEEFQRRMMLAHKVSLQHKDVYMEKAKLRYDRDVRKVEYAVGDWVLVDNPQPSSPFDTAYTGPYRVIKTLPGGSDYVVERAEGRRKCELLNVKRMKTFFGVRSTSDSRPQKETGSVSPINSPSEQVRRVKRKYVKSSHARWVKASENRVKRRREIEARLGISKPTKLNERVSEKRGRGRPRG